MHWFCHLHALFLHDARHQVHFIYKSFIIVYLLFIHLLNFSTTPKLFFPRFALGTYRQTFLCAHFSECSPRLMISIFPEQIADMLDELCLPGGSSCVCLLANFPAFSLSDIDYYLLERIFLYVLFFSLYFLIHFCVQFSLPGVVVVIIRRWSFLLEKQLAGRKKSKWVVNWWVDFSSPTLFLWALVWVRFGGASRENKKKIGREYIFF